MTDKEVKRMHSSINPDTTKSNPKISQSILPNINVVSSLFESYLNIRKDRWKLAEDKPIQLITSSNTANKIKTCIELLEQFQKAKSFDDWINVIYLCAHKENTEKANISNSWFYGLTKFFTDKPLLLLTIHAANAYILSQLMQNDAFGRLKETMTTQKTTLENAIKEALNYHTAQTIIDEKTVELEALNHKLTALNMLENYHHAYFLDIILARELKAKELDEKSFTDYEQHVLKGERQLSMCKTLLGYNESTKIQFASLVESTKKEVTPSTISNNAPQNTLSNSEETIFSKPPASGLAIYSTFADSRKDNPQNENKHSHNKRYNLRNR